MIDTDSNLRMSSNLKNPVIIINYVTVKLHQKIFSTLGLRPFVYAPNGIFFMMIDLTIKTTSSRISINDPDNMLRCPDVGPMSPI